MSDRDDLYTTDELLAQKISYQWVLDNLLPAGAKMLFHGREGIGKSLFALQLGIAVLQEGHLLGEWQAHRRGSVLYVQADLPMIEHRDRLARLVKHWPWMRELPLYHYCPPFFDVMQLDEDDDLTGRLQETQPCLVIWDVLRAIEHMEEKEHVPGLVYGQMRNLFPLAAHFVIHHDKKVTKDASEGYLDHREAFSGMKGWSNLVISTWHLEEQGNDLLLTTTKNNCGPKGQEILLHQDPTTFFPVCRLSRTHETTRRWRLTHGCNPKPLQRGQREELRRHLLASGVATTDAIERVVQGEK